MIASIIRGSDFGGLYRYLTDPAKGLRTEDVVLLNVTSLETSAAEMRLAASRSKAVNPVYHLILAWRRDEDVEPRKQRVAAEELLRKIGLADHQAVIVTHHEPKAGGLTPGHDGRHFETHIMTSRVGPDGRAKRMSWDKAVVERAVAEIAIERKFLPVRGRFNGDLIGTPESRDNWHSEASRSLMAATGRPSVCASIRADTELMASLTTARGIGWDELVAVFDGAGFRLEESARRGRVIFKDRAGGAASAPGLVVVDKQDERRREKISALDTPDLKWGRGALERVLGPLAPESLTVTGRSEKADLTRSQSAKHAEDALLRARFEQEKSLAREPRRALVAAHARERDRLWGRYKADRQRLIAYAKFRRLVVRAVFGRRSRTGRKLNEYVDRLTTRRLGRHQATFKAERSALRDSQSRQLEGTRPATWAEWLRAERLRMDAEQKRSAPPQNLALSAQQLDEVTDEFVIAMGGRVRETIRIRQAHILRNFVDLGSQSSAVGTTNERAASGVEGSKAIEAESAGSDRTPGQTRAGRSIVGGASVAANIPQHALEVLRSVAQAEGAIRSLASASSSVSPSNVALTKPGDGPVPESAKHLTGASSSHSHAPVPSEFRVGEKDDQSSMPFPFEHWDKYAKSLAKSLLRFDASQGGNGGFELCRYALLHKLKSDQMDDVVKTLRKWSADFPKDLDEFNSTTSMMSRAMIVRGIVENPSAVQNLPLNLAREVRETLETQKRYKAVSASTASSAPRQSLPAEDVANAHVPRSSSEFPFSTWREYPRRIAKLLLVSDRANDDHVFDVARRSLAFHLQSSEIDKVIEQFLQWSTVKSNSLDHFLAETKTIDLAEVEQELDANHRAPLERARQAAKNLEEEGRRTAVTSAQTAIDFAALDLPAKRSYVGFVRASWTHESARIRGAYDDLESHVGPATARACESWNRFDRDISSQWLARTAMEDGGPIGLAGQRVVTLSNENWLPIFGLLYQSIATPQFEQCETLIQRLCRAHHIPSDDTLRAIHIMIPERAREIERRGSNVEKLTLEEFKKVVESIENPLNSGRGRR